MADFPKIRGYQVNRFLGKGGYGTVYSVVNSDGNAFAAKEIIMDSGTSLVEIDLMLRIDHPHIVKAVDLVREDNKVYLIEELGYSFADSLSTFSRKDKIRVIFELGCALQYLQEYGIAHCDLKTDNIILVDGHVKLADLGIANYAAEKSDTLVCESVVFRAPEYLIDVYLGMDSSEKPVNPKENMGPARKTHNIIGRDNLRNRNIFKSELWSYGLVCMDIIYGENFVFSNLWEPGNVALAFIPQEKHFEYLLENLGEPEHMMDMFELVLSKLLQVNPDDRTYNFNSFIDSNIFKENGFERNSPVTCLSEEINTSIISPGHRDFFRRINNWIIEVCYDLELSNIVSFLALHLIRTKWNDYVKELRIKPILLFVFSCVNIAMRVIGLYVDEFLLARYFKDAKEKPLFKDLPEYTFDMVMKENGKIGSLTIYDYLSSAEMLADALYLMMNSDEYFTLNVREFANLIRSRETIDGANNRTLKDNMSLHDILSLSKEVKKSASPKEVKKSASPKAVKKSASPKVVKKSASPKVVKKSASPKAVKKSASPKAVKKSASPKAVKKSASPKAVKKSASPKRVGSKRVGKSAQM